jgi:hypothetical protein
MLQKCCASLVLVVAGLAGCDSKSAAKITLRADDPMSAEIPARAPAGRVRYEHGGGKSSFVHRRDRTNVWPVQATVDAKSPSTSNLTKASPRSSGSQLGQH